MAQIHGIIDRIHYVWTGHSWVTDLRRVAELSDIDAHKQLRIITANNRFLDLEDQVEARVVESR